MSASSNILQGFNAAAQTLERLLADVSPKHALSFPLPHMNNMLWHAGHITLTRSYFIESLCREQRVSILFTPEEQSLFTRGGRPPRNPEVYPSTTRLMECFTAMHSAWIAYLENVGPAELTARYKSQSLADLLHFLVRHEFYHLGQIGCLRSFYGYPGVFDIS